MGIRSRTFEDSTTSKQKKKQTLRQHNK